MQAKAFTRPRPELPIWSVDSGWYPCDSPTMTTNGRRPRRRGVSVAELTSFVVYGIAGYWLVNPTFSTTKRVGALVVIIAVLFGNDLRPFRRPGHARWRGTEGLDCSGVRATLAC